MRNFDPHLLMIEVAMKTTARIQLLLPVSTCLLFAMAAMSCQTNTKPSSAAVQQPVMRKNWVKVSSHPPIYYPKGVAADCPTDHWSGEWVDTGDEKGTRYFIPLHGLGDRREALVDDALSARSERKLEQVAAEDDEILARNIRNAALFGPPVYSFIILGAMAGVSPPYEVDIHRLQKEWHSAREAH